jgi:N utilization substance protein A
VRVPGVLDSFNLSPEDAEALIMRARVAAGWIEPEPEPEPEEAEEEFAESEGFEGEGFAADGEASPADEQLPEGSEADAQVFGEELERTRDA